MRENQIGALKCWKRETAVIDAECNAVWWLLFRTILHNLPRPKIASIEDYPNVSRLITELGVYGAHAL